VNAADNEAIREGLPTICMDPDVHYALGVSKKTVTLGLLTDRRIAFYQRQRDQQRDVRLRQVGGNRLVYSA
jgi:hypothetical protein